MGSGLSGQDLSQRRTRASTSAAITTTVALLFCLCLSAGEVTTGGPVANGAITPQPRAQIDHRIFPLMSRASDRSPAPVIIRSIGKRSNRSKTNRNTEGAFAEGWRARKLQATENLLICLREIISSRLDAAIMKRGPPLQSGAPRIHRIPSSLLPSLRSYSSLSDSRSFKKKKDTDGYG